MSRAPKWFRDLLNRQAELIWDECFDYYEKRKEGTAKREDHEAWAALEDQLWEDFFQLAWQAARGETDEAHDAPK